MTGRLDRYVFKAVVGSYVATLLLVVFLFVVFDMLLNMGKYLEAAEEQNLSIFGLLLAWGQFHMYSLPWIFVTVAPFVTIIGSMFAIARFMAQNEIVPMIFTGRSTARVLTPTVVMGLISAATMAGLWEFVLPRLLVQMDRLQSVLEPEESLVVEGIALRDGTKTLLCDRFDPHLQRMRGVDMLDRGSQAGDLVRISALEATWNPEKSDWELVDGVLHSPDGTRDVELLGMSVTPEIVWLAGKEDKASSLLSYTELSQLIALSPGRKDLVIAFHYHLTWPLANLVLLMLVLPFAVHFERGSNIGRVVLAILVCGAYLTLDLTCQNLGRGEYLHPVVASWTPPILFGSLGLVMFGGMRS